MHAFTHIHAQSHTYRNTQEGNTMNRVLLCLHFFHCESFKACLYLHVCASTLVCGGYIYYSVHMRFFFCPLIINEFDMRAENVYLLQWVSNISKCNLLFHTQAHTHRTKCIVMMLFPTALTDYISIFTNIFQEHQSQLWDPLANLMLRFKVVVIPPPQNKKGWPSVLFWLRCGSVHTK